MPATGRLQVPQPAPFLQHPGDPPLPVTVWFTAFDTYLDLAEEERGQVLMAALKNSLLFSLLGTEGQRCFGSHPLVPKIKEAATKYVLFKKAVLDHFKRPTNVARTCLEFRRRFQGPDELATNFLAALHELAPDCKFPDGMLPRELALQILTGCRSQKAREWMLLRPVALDYYMQILETDEAVKEDAAAFAAASSQSSYPAVHPYSLVHLRNPSFLVSKYKPPGWWP